jgi:hypothetical protein
LQRSWTACSAEAGKPALSYFNELAGGPDREHKYLVDSNIDWGQDLFFFNQWAEHHPEARPMGLAYLNFVDYRVAGVSYHEVAPEPRAGWFAVDVENLTSPYRPFRYFQRFQPVAKAGWSIFIYHVSDEEAKLARAEMGLPPTK